MRIDAFDFELPQERIALQPAEPRDHARMLVVWPDGKLSDRQVLDLPDLLRPGDVLVFNDTRVIRAQLSGVRSRDGHDLQVGITLIERLDGAEWWSFSRPGKRLKIGDRISFGAGSLKAEVLGKAEDGRVRLRFDRSAEKLDEALERVGAPPLPPYIATRRAVSQEDQERYQTIYARHSGAVAAPTAGLHFTERLFKGLEANSLHKAFVTLHVGAGTFLPVKVDDTDDHVMHAETGEISADTADWLNRVRAEGGRIVAVGTTSLRLLESAADPAGIIRPFAGATDIFITPGYRFRAVDVLMTNFHLPRSTLFMLVAAFSGLETMQRAYRHAVEEEYRFYSYG
ncbi:MAG TPA: tRNA preQ1(34) S-adenosylmethionine ribosyltransferase-isomerase QueA, partial [Afifellaceae bacterium]|nr:tRNA preQ1(34) S-adenosylmethionine ribosyltransferase-isomerase QueA [Afifellaceae bacterium]